MSDQIIRAYPNRYTPSDLDVVLDMSFKTRDGTVWRPPDMRLVAGTCGTWVLHMENRACDLRPSGALNIVRLNCQIAFKMQAEVPQKRDYCTLETDSGASLKLIVGRATSGNLLSIVVESGAFKKGETCTVRIGDRGGGSVGSEVFWTTTTGEFLLAVDTGGTGDFRGVRGNPHRFRIVAHQEAKLFRLLGPTVAKTGAPFALHLGVFDRNRNVIESFEGSIHFEVPDGVEGLPDTCVLTPQDAGLKIFEGVRIHKPGVTRIGLCGEGVKGRCLGNPIVVEDRPQTYVYWGDVHAHGWGDFIMYQMYLRSEKLDPLVRHRQGRQVGRFDFACPAAMAMDPEKREEIFGAYREACAQMDEPDRYVPFLAYEGHPRPNHEDRQIIFKTYTEEGIPPPVFTSVRELDETFRDRDDVLMQVHIGGWPPRWDLYRPAKDRMLEVCSGFGCAEWLLQRGLKLGYKPAVCAASDLHLGLMGGPRGVETFRGRFGSKYPMRQRDAAYGTGPVTAIVAPELTRERLWAAIGARQTYATSGARIYLDLSCNGAPIGFDIDIEGELRVAITCHACAPIDRIDLIIGEYCAKSWYLDAMDFTEEIAFAPSDLPGNWIYVRVHQVDNEFAWSSPVWLKRDGPLPPPRGLPRWNEQEEIDLSAVGEESGSYLGDLERYLELEEDPERFQEITPIGVAEQSVGRCALFYCYWGEERLPMSIRWFFEFEIPKIRYDFGWRDFGAFDELELGPRLMEKYG